MTFRQKWTKILSDKADFHMTHLYDLNLTSHQISCPIVLKNSILTSLIDNKMLIYFVLPLVFLFSFNRQLKKSIFEKNVMFPDTILTYIHMTQDPSHLFVSQTLS